MSNVENTRISTALYEHWRIAFSEGPFPSDRLYRTQYKTASAKNLQQTKRSLDRCAVMSSKMRSTHDDGAKR